MTELFVTRSGRVVPERDTDQAGTGLKIRTVSRYTDGRPIDRPQLCVSIGERRYYFDQRAYETAIIEAAGRAERLDRRSHVLWDVEDYILPADWPAFADTQLAGRSPELIEALRCILVEGMPIGEATGETDQRRRRNARTTLRRVLNELGWGVGEQ